MRKTKSGLLRGIVVAAAFVVAIPAALTWRQVHLEQLNRQLIAAVKANDEGAVTALLERGADAGTHDDPPRALNLWQLLREALQHKTRPSNAPSALQLALDWRPETPQAPRPTVADSPVIQALVRHGARSGPREILARMERNYAFCRSYEDTGDLDMTGNTTDHLAFRTAFVAPRNLFFEYQRSQTDHVVIWQKEGVTRSWWGLQGGVSTSSLEMAIAGATGISLGAADRIPGALAAAQMGGWGGMSNLYTNLRIADIEPVEGSPCYKLLPQASPAGIMTKEIYIDARTFLLRKIVEDYQGGDICVTIYHRPRIDIPIPASRFQFKPPHSAQHR